MTLEKRRDAAWSVVVTAHNAAADLEKTLDAIAAAAQHAGGGEVIIVDDRSTDRTAAVAAASSILGLRLIQVRSVDESALMSARQNALDLGFRAATGEIVLVLDADARPGPTWISDMIAPIADGSADAVASAVTYRPSMSLIGAWQTVETAVYLRVSSAMSAVGVDGGVLFGAFAFRRALCEEIGGFSKLGHSLTEDLTFARTIRRRGARVRYMLSRSAEVEACADWKAVVVRAKRVMTGPPGPLAFVFVAWFAILLATGAAAVLIGSWLAAMIFLARYLLGVAIAVDALRAARQLGSFWIAPAYEPIGVAVGLCTGVLLTVDRRVAWGGRDYRV